MTLKPCLMMSGSLLNTEGVSIAPYDSEALPDDVKALMCCSMVSWNACKLERELDGFPRLSKASMWALMIL